MSEMIAFFVPIMFSKDKTHEFASLHNLKYTKELYSENNQHILSPELQKLEKNLFGLLNTLIEPFRNIKPPFIKYNSENITPIFYDFLFDS